MTNRLDYKKNAKLFASSKKSSTFASRLLSKVYKRLVLSILRALCPGAVKYVGLKMFFSSNNLKRIKSGYFKLQDHFCKQGNSPERMGCC